MVAILCNVILIKLNERGLGEFRAVEVKVSLKKFTFINAKLVYNVVVFNVIFADLSPI